MSLQEEIDKLRGDIRTDSYSMSIGEWLNLYEHSEVDIHPEFQRFFRWNVTQKTLFIESLLLGIPIPPIFISQREDGVWDVIDGLQRLSTIYHFFGILKDEKGQLIEPLVLEKTKHLPSLEGIRCHDEDNPDHSLTTQQRLFIKRAKLPVSILLKESDQFAKYELFQRLNTGGTQLSSQELRNCILVQQNRKMYEWLRELANDENFRECVLLTEKQQQEQYDLELALRFLVFRQLETSELRKMTDIDGFLTEKMVIMASAKEFNYQLETQAFKRTFDLLFHTCKENSLRRYDPIKQKFVGGFLLAAFEIFGVGIGYHYSTFSDSTSLEEKIKHFWSKGDPDFPFASNITGVRTVQRLRVTLPLGRKLFAP
jgi:hypothetical protein